MIEEILEILEGIRPDVDFRAEKQLIDGKVLDSFDIIAIVSELDEAFDVQIPIDDLEPKNFNTIEAIEEVIIKLQEED